MKLRLPPSVIKQSHAGHKWLGLAMAAILYLICLSGTATVFYMPLERWETPALPDITRLDPAALARAVAETHQRLPGANSLYVYLPSRELPRLSVSAGDTGLGFDAAGHYAGSAAHPVIDALLELHYYLHLPSNIGLIIVGLAGVALLALIIGGLLSHPRLFQDAFKWRRHGQPRLSTADLHNRIGVWATPFHIAIALTGSVIALANVVLLLASWGFYHNDRAAAAAPLLPPPIAAAPGTIGGPALIQGLAELRGAHPDAEPILIGIEQGAAARFSIYARLPERLIFEEEYQFDANGHLRGSAGYADGAAGRQIYASLYRLHFGSFGGPFVQWLYVLLGLALCLMCGSGIDLWLIKSAQRGTAHPRLHRFWAGFVWGAPIALCGGMALGIGAQMPLRIGFWSLLALLTLLAGVTRQPPRRIGRLGRGLLAIGLLLLLGAHVLHFGRAAFSPAGLYPDLCLLLMAGICGVTARPRPLTETV